MGIRVSCKSYHITCIYIYVYVFILGLYSYQFTNDVINIHGCGHIVNGVVSYHVSDRIGYGCMKKVMWYFEEGGVGSFLIMYPIALAMDV